MPIHKRFFILIITPIIMTFILIFFIILPAQNNLQSFKIELEKINNEFKPISERKDSQKLTELKLNNYLKETEFLNKLVIKTEYQLEFIKFLENLDKKHQLASHVDLNVPYSIVKSEQNNEKKIEQTIIPININISLIANFNQFLNYLIDLTKANYYINITSINIDIKNKQDLSVFFYKRFSESTPPAITNLNINNQDISEIEREQPFLFITLIAETYWVD